MKRLFQWLLAAILICSTSVITACSKDDEKKSEDVTPAKLAGFWVTDNAESGTDGEASWTRVVEDYLFYADGTGYYESYQLDGSKYVKAKSVRDNGTLHFTVSGNTVTVKGDENNMTQTLTYADGKLTAQGKTWQKATLEQQALVNQLYGDWQAANSASQDTDDSKFENVDGNVDINNGGGGVTDVR